VAAVVAAVLWTPWAALAVLPYLLGRPELLRRPRTLGGAALVDAAATAGHLHGSIRGRALVL
jgi:hypothetical protein